MKRITQFLAVIGIGVLVGTAGATTVSVSGNQLLVNCSPFMVRGMNYSPSPTGDIELEWCTNTNLVESDFALMQAMGVNTIRVYFDYYNSGNFLGLYNSDGTVNSAMLANYNRALSMASHYGIYVIADVWVDYNTDYSSDATGAANTAAWETQFDDIIELFKNSPAILMWAVGDENNNSVNLTAPMTDADLFAFYQEVISNAKTNADNTHPYTAVLVNNNDVANTSLTGAVPSIDLWSVNIYQKTSAVFNSNIATYTGTNPTKPLLITEFGNDAFNTTNIGALTGVEDDAAESAFFADVWPNSLGPALSANNAASILVGACAFEWSDEWWKYTPVTSHQNNGVALNVNPDTYGNQEWFGIFPGISQGVTARTARAAYTTLQGYWTNSPYDMTTAGACSGSTPTPPPLPTAIPTPNSSCVTVLDDFNNGGVGGGVTDVFNGNITTFFGSGGGGINFQAPGYSGYAADFGYYINTGSYGELIANLSANASPNGTGTGTVDMSSYGEISFWVNASTVGEGNYTFAIGSDQTYGGVNYSWWQTTFTATNAWTQVVLPFNTTTFTNPGGSNTGTLLQNMQNATSFDILPTTQQAVTAHLWLDEMDLTLASCLNNTPTNTATRTSTSTATNTATSTSTNTPTNTATNTSTNTSTATTTNTATETPTNTPLITNTFTNTATETTTDTPVITNTFTDTPTNTATSTMTNTVTDTSTQTSTDTATNTITGTIPSTDTSTNTATNTSTATVTNTATNTSSSTTTNTPTQTPTSTPVTSSVSQGPAPPSNSTQLPGATNVQVLQVVISNPSGGPITTTDLTLTDSGTGNTSGITGVTLVKNATNLSTATFSGSTATFSPFSDSIPASGSVTYLVTADFSGAALGTYTFSLTAAIGTNGQVVDYSGLPLTGATVTVAEATSTATMTSTCTVTNTPLYTETSTSTSTSTASSTNTPTNSPTNTSTNLPTSTFTSTPTITPTYTPTVPLIPVIAPPFPNPSTGSPITFNVETPAESVVTMDIFTLSFRKIASQRTQIDGAGTLQWNLKDIMGVQVADGLYYVRIHVTGVQSSTKILKVLILR